MMNQIKLTSILFSALLVGVVATGCSNEKSLPDSSAHSTSEPTPSSSTMSKNVEELLEELEMEQAAPSDFIKLAKDYLETADEDTDRLLIQAIFKAQKDYPAQAAAAYETANADEEFSTLYAVDITPDLAAKITNEDIAKTVNESYANGFKLSKAEGYIFPIIDIEIYETFFFSYLSDTDADSLKKDIEEFNKIQ